MAQYSRIILQKEFWLNIDKLSSSTLDFIRSNGSPRCCDLYSCYGLCFAFLVGMATLMLGVPNRTLSQIWFLEERHKEHLREPSPIQVHSQLTGHQLSQDNFNITDRKDQDLTRLNKESIYIRINNPTLNRNIGKFQLNHIWDKVLFGTPNI